MLKKYCNHSGCEELIDINLKHCEKHKNYYDKNVRQADNNKQYDDFYHSKDWMRAKRPAVIRDHSLCVMCLADKKIVAYNVVHHLKSIKTLQGWQERYNLSGLICLCEQHHQLVEAIQHKLVHKT